MKKIIARYIYIVIIATLGFVSCSDDDDIKVANISLPSGQGGSGQQVTNNGGTMTLTIKDNATLQLNVHVMPTDATNKDVAFESNNPDVFEVSNDGLLTPKSIGKDTLYIKALDGSNVSVRYLVDVITHIVKVSSITIASDALSPTLEIGSTFDLAAKVTINPKEATDPTVSYKSSDETIAKVDSKGIVTPIAEGRATITITANDGSGKTAESNFTIVNKFTGPLDIDRKDWIVTTSVDYEYVPDGETGKPSHIIDGEANTFLSMVKPGKSYGDYSTPAGHELHFIIDMGSKQKFEYIKWSHRGNNGSNFLRVWGIDIYGSDDGKTYKVIKENIDIPYQNNTQPIMLEMPSTECRYVKVFIRKWSDNSGGSTFGGTVQIAEFGLGNIIK